MSAGTTQPTTPPRRLILGTAGHVDHGKTELVKALTGHDTDRLQEEKDRGISILLGFAPLALGDDLFFGVVDVPGHERFVKQMVAGAGGIDLAMLLVAADEGVMPQTREHVEVLSSLELGAGVVVISKVDLASADTMTLLREEIADLTHGTFLADAPVVETSARSGAGLDVLRETLRELSKRVPPRDTDGPFRLAIDRVFHRKGIGVVITGSAYSGAVAVGDALELLPRKSTVRVRGIESFGVGRERGHAGERLALALQGVKLDDIRRGDTLATPGRFNATNALDARVRVAGYDEFALRNRERIRIHHGAREVLGRVILLEGDTLTREHTALVQIRLESPLVAETGDALVVRTYSPPRVCGGGVVIDPAPERHKRFDDDTLERLRVREQGDPEVVLLGEVEAAGIAGLPRADLDGEVARRLLDQGRAVDTGGTIVAEAVLASFAERAEDEVSDYIARHPLRWGIDKEELRQRLKFPGGATQFNRVLERVSEIRPLRARENRVRAGDDTVIPDEATAARLAALRAFVDGRGLAFPSRPEVEAAWQGTEPAPDAIQFLKDTGELIDVGAGLISRGALEECVRRLAALFEDTAEASVPEIKAAWGLSRKHVIPLLEYLDAARVTARRGNVRVRGSAMSA